jgi:hypothetical protein
LNVHTLLMTAMPNGAFAAGAINENAAHRLGGGAEEMRAILKGRGITAAQPQPGLVDEGGGLERMAGRFVGHLLRRQTAEFFVNDGEKFGGGFWITVFHPLQNMRELAQVFRIVKRRWVTTSNAQTINRIKRVSVVML